MNCPPGRTNRLSSPSKTNDLLRPLGRLIRVYPVFKRKRINRRAEKNHPSSSRQTGNSSVWLNFHPNIKNKIRHYSQKGQLKFNETAKFGYKML